MKKQLLVWVVCGLLLSAVLGVRSFNPSDAPRDELLAYEVTDTQSVEVTLHGGVEEVSVTSWLLVPFELAKQEEYPYGLEVRLTNAQGVPILGRRYEAITRLSKGGGSWASLSDGEALVALPRTQVVDVSGLAGHAGRLQVRAAAGEHPQVLLRLSHSVPRTSFEKALMARTLGAQDRRRLTEDRTSLGFFDIPEDVRSDALSHWQRRLTAAGRAGRDYRVRRLLIGREREEPEEAEVLQHPLTLSPVQRVALNLRGGMTLRVHSQQATTLRVGLAHELEPVAHPIVGGGALDLEIPDRGLSTVVLSADEISQISLSTDEAGAYSLLREDPLPTLGNRFVVIPDYRSFDYYQLDPETPLRVAIAPGQPELGLRVRSMADTWPPASSTQLHIEVRDAAGKTLRSLSPHLSLPESRFEVSAGRALSDSEVVRIHVPSEAASVDILGDSETLGVPFTDDPEIGESTLREPYDIPLPPPLRFKHAPLANRSYATLRPDNYPALRAAGRIVRVKAQVRIVAYQPRGTELEPRVLEPLDLVTSRSLFSPASFDRRLEFPFNGWVMLSRRSPQVSVRAVDPTETSLLFLLDPSHGEERFGLLANGASVMEESRDLLSGERRVELSAQPQQVSTYGLGERGLMLLRAIPTETNAIVKRQSVYALEPGSRVRFGFQRNSGELLAILVSVITRRGAAALRVRHRIDQGNGSPRLGHFYWRPTQWTSPHSLRTGDGGRGLVWTEPEDPLLAPLPDAVGGFRVELGDDLPVGAHILTLNNLSHSDTPGRNTTWVRAVLVGRAHPTNNSPPPARRTQH